MTKIYFTELANYNNWADAHVIDWLTQIDEQQWEQEITSSFNSISHTVLHIVGAKKIWVDFWTKRPDPVYLSSYFNGTKDELISLWQKASEDLRQFIDSYPEEEYNRLIDVIYPNGKKTQLEFWQTLPHFVNHATYHRGQLVTMLRQAGFTNFINTDLFTYFLAIK